MSKYRTWAWAALPIALMAVGLAFAPHFAFKCRAYAFLGVLILLAAELAVIGWLVNNRPIGAFIDNRNRLSLSKLQAGAWTVVVLSAFATIAAFNVAATWATSTTVTALAIQIPGELLLAMGISATSLVATPALLSLKSDETPAPGAQAQAAAKLKQSVSANGKVLTKTLASEASWGDLVTGDELGNAGSPDLGKIQQALITLLLLGCYVGYVFASLSGSSATISSLPLLDKSFVWLLGISHASYLAYKAAPHTQTASN
jgi:hypothetical protein